MNYIKKVLKFFSLPTVSIKEYNFCSTISLSCPEEVVSGTVYEVCTPSIHNIL
jgi:hypothetical protein